MKKIFIVALLIVFTYQEDIIDDAKVIKNRVWDGYEKNTGAHYYAYSPYKTGYSKVTTYIELPNDLNTNNGKRNAYISLGVLGLNGSIDLGIMNSGVGWLPYYYDIKTGDFKAFKDDIAPTGTKIIGIEIDVTITATAIFNISFRKSNLSILQSFSTKIDASHILVYENSKVKLRFYRFASLCPVEADNQNDGTYMLGGKFTGLTIVNNDKAESWGISSDNIEVSWLVSSSRIRFSYQDDEDSFSINHTKNPNF